jgi:hypothetical protein
MDRDRSAASPIVRPDRGYERRERVRDFPRPHCASADDSIDTMPGQPRRDGIRSTRMNNARAGDARERRSTILATLRGWLGQTGLTIGSADAPVSQGTPKQRGELRRPVRDAGFYCLQSKLVVRGGRRGAAGLDAIARWLVGAGDRRRGRAFREWRRDRGRCRTRWSRR